jgi:hypothetical protein
LLALGLSHPGLGGGEQDLRSQWLGVHAHQQTRSLQCGGWRQRQKAGHHAGEPLHGLRLVEALQQHQGVAPFVEVGGLGALQQCGEGLPGLRLFRGVPQGAGIEPAGLPDLQPKGVGLRGVHRTQGV